jgi:hypothetical protein
MRVKPCVVTKCSQTKHFVTTQKCEDAMQSIIVSEGMTQDNILVLNFAQGDSAIVTIALSRFGEFVVNYAPDWTQLRPLVSGYTRIVGRA